MPTGAMRIAAPFVVPCRPTSPQRRAREHALDGQLGRGAEQVERAPRAHVVLPGRESARELGRVDPARAVDEQPGEQQRLLGVVGD